MASSGNFPVWTDLVKGATNITKGGTRFDGSTNSRSAVIPFQVPTGTKFYIECLVTHATNYNIIFGLVNPYQDIATYIESQSTVNGIFLRLKPSFLTRSFRSSKPPSNCFIKTFSSANFLIFDA